MSSHRFADAQQDVQLPKALFQVAAGLLQLAGQAFFIPLQPHLGQHPVQGHLSDLDIERFDQIIPDSQAEGFGGDRLGAVGRHHDHRHIPPLLLQLPQDVQAVHIGQLQVEQDQVGVLLGDQAQGGIAPVGGQRPVAV